jgi:RimJ/RimL family protein N-acetyltransferase
VIGASVSTGPLPLPAPELVDLDRSVRLRPWRLGDEDVAALLAAWHDPDIGAGNPVPAEATAERARRWIAGEPERRARALALDLVIGPTGGRERDRVDAGAEPGGAVWGEVGLRGFDPVAGRAEVGWWLAPHARGRGVAPVALNLLTSWALRPPLGLRQVWARMDPANAAAARVASAAGFRLLGRAGGADIWARLH